MPGILRQKWVALGFYLPIDWEELALEFLSKYPELERYYIGDKILIFLEESEKLVSENWRPGTYPPVNRQVNIRNVYYTMTWKEFKK